MSGYRRLEVLQELYAKAKTVSDNVFVTSRPTATEQMTDFIIVRLPQGIDPYADTHNTAYGQIILFVKDRQGGTENAVKMDEMIDAVKELFPFNDSLLSCNNAPLMMPTKSDGMGFHSTIIQFKLVIKI